LAALWGFMRIIAAARVPTGTGPLGEVVELRLDVALVLVEVAKPLVDGCLDPVDYGNQVFEFFHFHSHTLRLRDAARLLSAPCTASRSSSGISDWKPRAAIALASDLVKPISRSAVSSSRKVVGLTPNDFTAVTRAY